MVRQRRKDIEQQAARDARKAEQRIKKSRIYEEPSLVKDIGKELFYKRILVITEGKNTEPSYFKKFRYPNVELVTVGTGLSTCRLVKEVEAILNGKYRNKRFDEIWVVFDKDDNKDFQEAINMAKKKGYNVAYSNQAIEYWFLLHFNDHQGGALDRKKYSKMLNDYIKPLGAYYDENIKEVSQNFFDIMEAVNPVTKKRRIQDAYDRADRIFKNKNDKTEESITTIFMLIETITGISPNHKI